LLPKKFFFFSQSIENEFVYELHQILDYKIQIEIQTPFVDNKLKISQSIIIHISIKTNHMPYRNQVEHHPDHKNVDVQEQVN